MRIPSKIVFDDEIIKKRIKALLLNENISLAAIQRCANVGYPTAGRMVDEMLSLGLIISQDKEILIGAKFDFSKKEQLEEYLSDKIRNYNS